jgi:hypothetical protein
MKKRVVVLSLLLTISLIPAYSAIPPKAGSVCSKQGMTKTFQGKKFTCIKSGKKSIWNAGEAVRKATPSPAPSPTPTIAKSQTPTSSPTPTIATTTLRGSPEQIQSYENMKKAMVPGAVGQLFRFHYSPNAKNDFKEYLESELNYAMTYWTSVYKNPEIFNVFYGTEKDLDWLIDAWRPYGFDKNKGFADDLRGRIQREGNNLNAGAVPSQSDSSHLSILRHSSLPIQINSFVPHENVHIVQQLLSKNQTDKMPCWLREGTANLFGNFTFAEKHGIEYYNRAKYGDINNYKWGTSGQEVRNFTETQWFTHLKSLEGNFQGGCDYTFRFAYGSGLLLSEILMAQGGFEKMMDFWRAFALEKDWRVSFREIYGIEIDTWYRQTAIPYVMKEYVRIQ